MKTYLITGGAGFIGSNFIFYMLSKYPKNKIVCMDNLTYAGNLYTLKSILNNSNFTFIKKSISDKATVYDLFERKRPDIVVNFAAETHVDRSIKNPEIFINTNIRGTCVLLDACVKYGIKRYHQISTDEVYGDLQINNPNLFFTESTSVCPNNPYSASKLAADFLVQSYHKTYGIPITISRSSNNYGPYHFPEKLIPLTIVNAIQNKPIPIYGDGLNIRDWLHVYDHCTAIDLIIANGTVGEIYNIGSHNEISNISLVKLICKILNKSERLIAYIEDRKSHDKRYAICADKICRELNWVPKIKFEDGIRKTIAWYVENKNWWESILSNKYRNGIKLIKQNC